MTTHAQFYLTRAAVARELAEGSKLDKLISDVTAEMRASPSPIDRVRIVPQTD